MCLCDSKTSAPAQRYLACLRASLFQCKSYSAHRNSFLKCIPADNVKYPEEAAFLRVPWNPAGEMLHLVTGCRGYALSQPHPQWPAPRPHPDTLPGRVSCRISHLLHGLQFLYSAALFRSLLSPRFHFNQLTISEGSH